MNISIIQTENGDNYINIIYDNIFTCVRSFKLLSNIDLICDNNIDKYILLLKNNNYSIIKNNDSTRFIDGDINITFKFVYSGPTTNITFTHNYELFFDKVLYRCNELKKTLNEVQTNIQSLQTQVNAITTQIFIRAQQKEI